jgi:hypothetical protein
VTYRIFSISLPGFGGCIKKNSPRGRAMYEELY